MLSGICGQTPTLHGDFLLVESVNLNRCGHSSRDARMIHGLELTFRPVSGTTIQAQEFHGLFSTLAASGFHFSRRAGRAAAEQRHILPDIRDSVA